jgi:hypothetical protein
MGPAREGGKKGGREISSLEQRTLYFIICASDYSGSAYDV